MRVEEQNAQLIGNKVTMYDNEAIQNNMGRALQEQGHVLEQNIERNQEIREEADASSEVIKSIQLAILRRKLMFGSIFVLAGLAVVFVVIRKLTK